MDPTETDTFKALALRARATLGIQSIALVPSLIPGSTAVLHLIDGQGTVHVLAIGGTMTYELALATWIETREREGLLHPKIREHLSEGADKR